METPPMGTSMSQEQADALGKKLGQSGSSQIKEMVPKGENQWSSYPEAELGSPTTVNK
jgi:Mn-containing catalase